MRRFAQLIIRVGLASAVLITASGPGSPSACSKDICGTECGMHRSALTAPTSCCEKAPPKESAPCKCIRRADEPQLLALSKAVQPNLEFPIIHLPTITPSIETRMLERAMVRSPRCHGPPGSSERAPDHGRAPPPE